MSVSVTESFLNDVLRHLEFIKSKFYDNDDEFEWDECFEEYAEGQKVDTLLNEVNVFLR